VYVWADRYKQRLEEEAWDFDAFMANDFEKYWKEEMAC
jgi:hypothetical protein